MKCNQRKPRQDEILILSGMNHHVKQKRKNDTAAIGKYNRDTGKMKRISRETRHDNACIISGMNRHRKEQRKTETEKIKSMKWLRQGNTFQYSNDAGEMNTNIGLSLGANPISKPRSDKKSGNNQHQIKNGRKQG